MENTPPILNTNWYRPGASEFDGFSNLYSELAEYFPQVSGVGIIGDLNIHHKRWLRFSNDNSRVGAEMKVLCDFHGLSQIVREPTRKEYLLDLAITDIVGAKAEPIAYIADHKSIQMKLPIPEIKEIFVERKVWDLKAADWKKLKEELKDVDWAFLERHTGEDACSVSLTSFEH